MYWIFILVARKEPRVCRDHNSLVLNYFDVLGEDLLFKKKLEVVLNPPGILTSTLFFVTEAFGTSKEKLLKKLTELKIYLVVSGWWISEQRDIRR